MQSHVAGLVDEWNLKAHWAILSAVKAVELMRVDAVTGLIGPQWIYISYHRSSQPHAYPHGPNCDMPRLSRTRVSPKSGYTKRAYIEKLLDGGTVVATALLK